MGSMITGAISLVKLPDNKSPALFTPASYASLGLFAIGSAILIKGSGLPDPLSKYTDKKLVRETTLNEFKDSTSSKEFTNFREYLRKQFGPQAGQDYN